MNTTTTTTPRISDHTSRWKAALRASDTGPLVIAEDVVAIADTWDRYKADVDDLDCTSFLRRELGPGRDLAFFQRRANAVGILGRACRGKLHHEVAVWTANHVEGEDQRAKAMFALLSATNKQRGNCLTLPQAKRVVAAALEWKPAAKKSEACARCARLEDVLRAHGIAVPEVE